MGTKLSKNKGSRSGSKDQPNSSEHTQEEHQPDQDEQQNDENDENDQSDEKSDVPRELPQLDVSDIPAKFRGKRNRRTSISAEVDSDPTSPRYEHKVIPKNESDIKQIETSIAGNFLFAALDKEQITQVIESMQERKVVPGEIIIKEGAEGDNFYIIGSGKYDVLKRIDGVDKKVFHYDGKGSFGELALMYNSPRAATIKAVTEGVLWAVSRATFRAIIISATSQQRKQNELWLKNIPFLSGFGHQERSLIADCLEPMTFTDGQLVIEQGEQGDKFFLIEKGEAVATQFLDGKEVVVGNMHAGDFFGERALITDEPRAANVKAVGSLKVAAMARDAFERLLGDRKQFMLQRIASYKTAREIVSSSSSPYSSTSTDDVTTAMASTTLFSDYDGSGNGNVNNNNNVDNGDNGDNNTSGGNCSGDNENNSGNNNKDSGVGSDSNSSGDCNDDSKNNHGDHNNSSDSSSGDTHNNSDSSDWQCGNTGDDSYSGGNDNSGSSGDSSSSYDNSGSSGDYGSSYDSSGGSSSSDSSSDSSSSSSSSSD